MIASALLVVSIGTHFARGGSFFGSVLALLLLVAMLLQREAFTGATDRTPPRIALRFVALVPLVAVVANTLGVKLASRHHRTPSWSRTILASIERLVGLTSIHLTDRADDIGQPVLTAIGLTSILIALYLFTRPVVDRRLNEQASTTERRLAEFRARDIVRRHGRGTLDYFALRDDKQFFFYRDSLVAYAVYGGVALVSPDPIGPSGERAEVFTAFRAYAERHGWTIAVVGAGAAWLDTYRRAGFHHLYVGDEAVVQCPTFSLDGGAMKGLRQACTRLAKKGYTVEFHDPATMDPSAIKGILDLIAKLRRGDGERGFSMMLGRLFNPKDKGLLLTLVRDPAGQPAAVCQFVPSPAIKGYSLDLMRRDPGEHPNGLIDYALCATIDELRRRGGQGLSLNFSAFRSILDGEKGDTALLRVERWALRRLSGILPIESLWSFNAKYHPDWLPRYLVYPAVESFVPVVAAVLRAESLTEIPVIGRLLSSDPSNRPGTVVPPEILEQAEAAHAER
jgi:lysyl-tRNA synthetase class 2